MPVRRRTAIVSCLLVVAALATGRVVAFTWSTGTAPAAPTAATPTVPVVAGTVKSGDVPIYLGGIGFVQAYNTVVVRSQIQGQLIQIPFTEGQAVHPRDLLAQIDPRPHQAQLDPATPNRHRHKAPLAHAQGKPPR